MTTHAHDVITESVRLAPSVIVTATSIMGTVTWSTAAYALTAIYTLLMIAQHVWEKWIKPWKKAKRGR